MKHLLLILISTLWSMAATAQDHGIYVNGDLQEQEVSRETLYQYARTVGVDDSVDVYILPTAEGLEYKTYVSLNEGTWTFHGNGSWISCFDKSNEPLRIHNVNVTFDNLSNEGIDGGAPTLFAGYSTNVTLSDCRLWGVVFKANQGMSTVTFTSGEYRNLRSKQTTTQKFYTFEKALAFATEHESAHIDVHQHDYKWGAYRMDKGNVTIDLHNNYINSLYDFYISTEPQFFHYVQHPDDYGAIVVSGGCLTINDDINSRGFFSYQGCIVASGHGTIVLNGGYHNSHNGIGIVACEQGEITINNGKYISTYTYKDKEDERYNSASIAALGEGHIRINGGSFQGLTPLYVYDKGKIDVYGGHFKSYEGAPAVTLDDGITLYGGHFTCTKGHSAIVYPNPDYYMHHFYDAANNFYDYYTGEMMLMTQDRSGSNHFVIYADDALTVYANDVYLAPKPIFQIQHLTHIIDEAKKGRASISDVESMVQEVLKN